MSRAGVPARLRPALDRLSSGDVPANVGLMHLLMEALSPEDAYAALAAASDGAPAAGAHALAEALSLLRAHPAAFATVKAVLNEARHDRPPDSPEEALRHWSGVFDRLSHLAPDGASALYGLGDADLLARATAEIVARLRNWALVGPDSHVLEIGCGSGRILSALAPLARRVTGTDISAGMVARARERCAGASNVDLRVSAGRDLAAFSGASFDLVLAVDVFPYLVQAGGDLARRHVEEAARVLRPGGACFILNYAYGGEPDADRQAADTLFRDAGLAVERSGTRDLALWDGVTFLARRAAVA